MPIIPFSFNNQIIEFELNPKTLKVNATQMAKIFDKDVRDFTMLKSTKDYIDECLKTENSRFLGIEKEEDLLTSIQQKGTLMHKVLALKFAAWLNPAFELWVYMTVEKIVFADYENLRNSFKDTAIRRKQIEEIKNLLREESPIFLKLEELQDDEKKAGTSRVKFSRTQIKMFSNADLVSND